MNLQRSSLDFLDVDRVRALRTLADLELDSVAIANLSFDLRLVNEEVVSVLLLDKSESFREVEPLDCSLCHQVEAARVYYFMLRAA